MRCLSSPLPDFPEGVGSPNASRRPGRSFLLLSVFVLLCPSQALCQSRRVLILHSYHPSLSWTRSLQKGIEEALNEADGTVDISVEYMDTKHHEPELTQEAFFELLKVKYRRWVPDVVISCDDDALHFLFQHRQKLFPDVPVVFCGLNVEDFDPEILEGHHRYTGVVEKLDIASTADLILQLYPQVNRIALIHDRTTTGLADRSTFEALADRYRNKGVDFIYPDTGQGLSEDELLAYLRSLGPDSAAYFVGFFRDRSGKPLALDRILPAICQASPRPVFAAAEAFLGYGILGGKLLSGEVHGRSTARKALAVLDDPQRLPPVSVESSNRYMFDYRQMQRFGLTLEDLPEGSIIKYGQPSFYQRHRTELLWGAIALAALLLFTTALLINTFRRRAAEQRLAVSEKKYRLLASYATDMISTHDWEGTYLYASPACKDLLGYEPEEMVGQNAYDFFHPDDIQDIRQRHQGLRAGQPIDSLTYRIRHKNGAYTWFESTTTLIDPPQQGRPERIIAVSRNITARKKAQQALARSEQRYRHLVENLPDVIYEYSTLRGALYWSQRACDIFGYDSQARREKPFLWRDSIDPQDTQRVAEAIRQAESGQSFDIEYRFRDAQGRTHWLRDRSVSIRREGEDCIIEGIATDITARKEAEEERTFLGEQLRQAQKMEAVGRLAGGIAHDFNNMLQTILGFADVLLEDIDENHTGFEAVSQIRHAAQRSADLTRQLLAYARKQAYSPRVVDLDQAVEERLAMLHRLIGEHIQLEFHPGEPCPVRVDPAQLDQVLTNLILNARDALATTGRITIQTATEKIDEAFCKHHVDASPGRYAVLTVHDNGQGMDAETLERVFEPFYTTKPQGKGTGLGLSTVYGIVRQNDGFALADSETENGSTFRIYLPEAQEDSSPESSASLVQSPAGEGQSILIVEDEPSVLALARRVLQQQGYDVRCAQGPQEALEMTESDTSPIDLLLTDVIMPEMSGKELARRLQERFPHMRCLFMSGYAEEVLHRDGLVDEGIEFLAKPFEPDQLKAAVGDL